MNRYGAPKIRIGNNSFGLFDVAVWFYLFAIIFADGTRILDGSVVVLLVIGSVSIIANKKLVANRFILLMAMFILYNSFMAFFGNLEYKDAAIHRVTTLTFNFVVNYILFNYFTLHENRVKGQRAFIYLCLMLILYILVQNGGSLLQGRFGRSVPYLFGLKGTNGYGLNTNFVCRILYTAFAFCMYQSWICDEQTEIDGIRVKREKRKFILLSILFAACSILTGSRAGIIVVAIFLLVAYTFRTDKLESRIKYLFIALLIIGLVYLIMMYVPALYNIAGRRFEVLLSGVFSDEGYEYRSSAYYRSNMIDEGLSIFSERPLTGWGLDYFINKYRYYSHNNFVEILVSCGLIGFTLYYAAILYLATRGLKTTKQEKESFNKTVKKESIIYLSFLVSIIFMNVAHVDYVARDTLLFLYMMAAATVDWRSTSGKHVLERN